MYSTTNDRSVFLQTLIGHYCNMNVVSRIIVIWQSIEHPPPRDYVCRKKGIFFLQGATDNILNRFLPIELILTPSFITCDDDIMVNEEDVVEMLNVWKAHQNSVVGPFARWVTRQGEYAYSYAKAAGVFYTSILTKFHISSTHLMHTIVCDIKYAEFRDFVFENINAEDLLYIKVASDVFHHNPSVLYRPKFPLTDYGYGKGLHKRRRHNSVRTAAVRLFGLADLTMRVTREFVGGKGFRSYRHVKEYLSNKTAPIRSTS